MADIVSKEKRSEMMANISGKDTKPEIALRKTLFAQGFRYRKNDKRLPGTPDIVLPKWNAVIFVHGCFWHRHSGCKYAYNPKTRIEFWKNKFEKNVERDRRHIETLLSDGWRVAVVWECQVSTNLLGVSTQIESWLKGGSKSVVEIG